MNPSSFWTYVVAARFPVMLLMMMIYWSIVAFHLADLITSNVEKFSSFLSSSLLLLHTKPSSSACQPMANLCPCNIAKKQKPQNHHVNHGKKTIWVHACSKMCMQANPLVLHGTGRSACLLLSTSGGIRVWHHQIIISSSSSRFFEEIYTNFSSS